MRSRIDSPARDRSRKLVAFLASFCFFLSAIEYMIPKPLPFMRIGLANLPVVLALDLLPASGVLVLVGLKILGQGLVSGSLFSYVSLFSAAGSLTSGLVMLGVRRIGGTKISFIGISVSGAVASNLVQIALARFFIFGQGALYIGPPFAAAGLVTGFLVGLFCVKFAAASRWYASMARAKR
jgi:heptaprenyl diphosphate synthase